MNLWSVNYFQGVHKMSWPKTLFKNYSETIILKIKKKTTTTKLPPSPLNFWLLIKWQLQSVLSSFSFLIFEREQEIFWEHGYSLLYKAHHRAFSHSLWIWTRNTRSHFLLCFWINSSGFAKEPCLFLSVWMKVKQKGLKWLVQEHFQAMNRTQSTGVLT